MGFALPAAIAAALCSPGRPVVAFTGDGGLAMTLAEIETAARLALRIVVIVFNDAALSLIKIKQRPAGQGGGEAVEYGPVSYARAAESMGAAAAAVSTEAELTAALAEALRRDGPTVIDARVDPAGYPAIMDLSRGGAGRRPESAPVVAVGGGRPADKREGIRIRLGAAPTARRQRRHEGEDGMTATILRQETFDPADYQGELAAAPGNLDVG